MKQLILDYRKWRCGTDSSDRNIAHGEGSTLLSNEKGYQCCLGQFALQLGATRVRGITSPGDLSLHIPGLNKRDRLSETGFRNTAFSRTAMITNDDEDTVIAVKVKKLMSLCKSIGYKLKLVNFPAHKKA